MEITLNQKVEKILEIIKSTLKAENKNTQPDNILDAAMLTAIEIMKNKNTKNLDEITQIIMAYKNYIKDNELTEEFVKITLIYQENETFLKRAFRVINMFLKNNKPSRRLFDVLLNFGYKKTLIRPKCIKIIKDYLETSEFADKLVEYSKTASKTESVRIINTFYDFFAQKVDIKSIIQELVDQTSKTVDVDNVSFFYKYVCYILVKYTETCEPKDYDFVLENIKILAKTPLERGDSLLKAFSYIANKDFMTFLSEKKHIVKFDNQIKDIIKKEISNESVSYEQVYELIKSIRHMLSSEFSCLISYIVNEFDNGNEKYSFSLGAITGIIGIETLYNMFEKDFDIKKWAKIIKTSSNTDLIFFMTIYKKQLLENEKANTEDEKSNAQIKTNIILSCLPALCNYCTDHNDIIDQLMYVFEIYLKNNITKSFVCNALAKIIHSHKNNIKNTLVLRNPIPRATSEKIIKKVYESNLWIILLNIYLTDNNLEAEVFLREYLTHDDYGLSSSIVSYILNVSDKPINIGENVISDITGALKIAKLLVGAMDLNFEVTSKLLELSLDDKPLTQKLAYQLLFLMKQYNKIDICICDSLFTDEMAEKTKISTQNSRIKLLFLIYNEGCSCFETKKKIFLNKMLPTLVLNLYIGNSKAKKTAEESLRNLISSFDDEEFAFYCKLMLAAINSDSIELRCGVLLSLKLLMDTFPERLLPETADIVYKDASIVSKNGARAILPVLKFLESYIKYSKEFNPQIAFEILELYIESGKSKFKEDIYKVIKLLKSKDIELPKKLKKLTKSTKSVISIPELQITKGNDVKIGGFKNVVITKNSRSKTHRHMKRR